MKRSVQEKYNYNKSKKTAFSYGYVWGVDAYNAYQNAVWTRQRVIAEIDDYKKMAVHGKGRSRECAKGYMCGVRDKANEHKSKRR